MRHAPAWLQQQGLNTQHLRHALVSGLAWEQPLVMVYGKQHRTPRLTCWVADPGCSYRYSGLQQAIHPWTAELETLRQLLLLEALGAPAPQYRHLPLVRDAQGTRLAKRHDALALRTLRGQGADPAGLRAGFAVELGEHPE